MKSTLQLIAVAGLALGHAAKVRTTNPKTAFCLTGNVREGHTEAAAKRLKGRVDLMDPDGLVFAYVNPCEAQSEPWWWHIVHRGGEKFVPKPPVGDCWGGSFFRENVKPTVIKEYRDPDVAPVPRPCPPGSNSFMFGVHQQWKGVQGCFKLIQEYEVAHSFKFESVVRVRADAGKTEDSMGQSTFCSLDKLDRQKVYLHDHATPGGGHHGDRPNYFDNFAILPRQYADVYFNAIDIWHSDCKMGGPGEAMLNAQMTSHHVPTEDKCECHHLCPPPGQALFIERRFLPDLESYEDVPIMEMISQPVANFAEGGLNATKSEFVKPAYMRLKLSPSSLTAPASHPASQLITNLASAQQESESATNSEHMMPTYMRLKLPPSP